MSFDEMISNQDIRARIAESMQRNVWERWKYNTTVLSIITINFPSSDVTTDNAATAQTTTS